MSKTMDFTIKITRPTTKCPANSFMFNVIDKNCAGIPGYSQPSSFLALSLEQDIPDYDMDSADEMWFDSQTTKSELTAFKFEQMMDRLEKITVCSLDDAKALVRRNEVNQDVFDYWVNKRLKTVSGGNTLKKIQFVNCALF